MTLTPASGTYLVWFASTYSQSNNAALVYPSIYAAGVQIAPSEMALNPGNAGYRTATCVGTAVVNGAQAIQGMWRTTAGTATAYQRTLMILKVG